MARVFPYLTNIDTLAISVHIIKEGGLATSRADSTRYVNRGSSSGGRGKRNSWTNGK